MDIKEVSSNSLSFIGDAVYTLRVREYFVTNKYQSSKNLQKMCNTYNCAKGQMKVFEYLNGLNFFNEAELDAYKRGRNHITHIPKNGDLKSYQCASGLEAIVGYLYLTDKDRLEDMFNKVFEVDLVNYQSPKGNWLVTIQ